jgi:tetratricopeptide (TPR) repeat protein
MVFAKLLSAPSGRRNVLRIPLLATFICVAIGCLALPKTDGVSLRQSAPPPPHTEFQIVDPAESQTPDPAAARAPRKYDTVAHRVLDIDAGEAPVPAARYAMLDDIIDDVKARVTYDPTIKEAEAQRRQASLILDTIDDVLTDHNFLYPPGDYDVTSLRSALAPQTFDRGTLEGLLRVDVNRRRKAHARAHAAEPFYIVDCDISSFIYAGVADALGFELRLVDLPDHMFVRWELPDGSHLNWDTNDAAVVPDEEYAGDYALNKRLRSQRVYLSSMTGREAEGFAYYLRATRFELRDQEERAIADLEKAHELYPQSTQAKSELAWLYATVPGIDAARRKAAIELAKSAVDLEPKVGDFWDSLAAAHAANGDFKRAVTCASKAEKLADNDEARGEYRERRKAYERGQMPSFKREPEAQKQNG